MDANQRICVKAKTLVSQLKICQVLRANKPENKVLEVVHLTKDNGTGKTFTPENISDIWYLFYRYVYFTGTQKDIITEQRNKQNIWYSLVIDGVILTEREATIKKQVFRKYASKFSFSYNKYNKNLSLQKRPYYR